MPMPKILQELRPLEEAGRKEEAAALLISRADAGDPEAQAVLANQSYLGNLVEKDYARAFHYAEKAAEAGELLGLHTLGVLYLYGYGCQADPAKGCALLEQATEMGDMKSPRYLGLCALEGLDGSVDYEKARYWFEKAAEKGDITSFYNLGRIYELGLGVTADLDTAIAWYRRAAVRKDHVGKPANDALTRLGVAP